MAVILRDLASADRIVGRHGYDMVLSKEVPVVGDESGINYEALVGVNPSHIVLELGAKGLPPRLQEMAAAREWTIVALPLLSLNDVEAAVPALAELVGTDAARSRARTLRTEMDRAWARSERTRALLGRTVVLSSIDPVGVMGPGSFHHEMIGRMGAVPVPEEGAAYITLSHEDLVRLNPDTIVLLSPSAPARFGFEIDAMGALASLPVKAIEERDLIVVSHPLCQTPSTALIDVADEIVKRYAHIRWNGGSPAATP
jgi:ABC-type Fe3+-hydroxamate transport system substrate-binding protein